MKEALLKLEQIWKKCGGNVAAFNVASEPVLAGFDDKRRNNIQLVFMARMSFVK